MDMIIFLMAPPRLYPLLIGYKLSIAVTQGFAGCFGRTGQKQSKTNHSKLLICCLVGQRSAFSSVHWWGMGIDNTRALMINPSINFFFPTVCSLELLCINALRF
ncbi:hypothetical protein ATANTOWER_004334 [Ataeniobius toweri]|uniref:Uncharacterized protein n=1 Tax=Ataeniobius toweri TaxID=208326 RepID=A0ABU7AXR2_9TELE|nr:hypothetical protein [Ataeniobius toweri]